MPTHQEIPRGHFDGVVCIGVPVPVGHPVAPPPPPTAASGGATHNNLDSDESRSHDRSMLSMLCPCFWFTLQLISAILTLCMIVSDIIYVLSNHHPSFKVESISVALDKIDISNNKSEAIRASWDVGFSIKNPGREISVSVRCMSSNWSANIIEGARNTTSVDAVVITLLPREFVLPELMVRGLMLQYDVLFRTDHRGDMVEGVCKNMTVAISPDATQGIMVGGQRSCHVH